VKVKEIVGERLFHNEIARFDKYLIKYFMSNMKLEYSSTEMNLYNILMSANLYF